MTKDERYAKFTADMAEAGRTVEEYHGRNFYVGPSVEVEASELQDVIRETTIRLQWDALGKDGLIIYPYLWL